MPSEASSGSSSPPGSSAVRQRFERSADLEGAERPQLADALGERPARHALEIVERCHGLGSEPVLGAEHDLRADATCAARHGSDDDLAAAVDALVTEGVYRSRSEAVRAALKELLRERRRQHEIEMYKRFPQTEEELAGIDEQTRRMIQEEPW